MSSVNNRTSRSKGRATSAHKYKFKQMSSPLRNPTEYNFMGMPSDYHQAKSRSPTRHDEVYMKQRMDNNDMNIEKLAKENYRLKQSLERQKESQDFEYQRRMGEKWDKQLYNKEQDKLGLLQKLNSGLVELNSINQQVEHLNKKYQANASHAFQLQKQIDSAHEEGQQVCQHLKDDLDRQKNQNHALDIEFQNVKQEKEEIMLRFQHKDAQITDFQKEAQAVSARMDQVDQAMQHLQSEYEIAYASLEATKREIEAFTEAQPATKERLFKLEKEIDQIVTQKQGLINQIASLKRKHDQFEMTLGEAKRQNYQEQRRKQKLLSNQIMCKLLNEIFRVRRQRSFDEIYAYSKFDSQFNGATKKICSGFKHIARIGQRRALYIWYQNALKPTDQIVRGEMLQQQIQQTLKSQQEYSEWKQKRVQEERENSDHYEAAKKIKIKIEKIQREEVARRFRYWSSLQQHNAYKENILRKGLERCFIQRQRKAYEKWKQETYELKETLRLEALITQTASQQYLQRLWYGWKESVFEIQNTKSNLSARAFKGWKDQIRKNKDLKKKAIAVLRMDQQRDTGLLQECFNALRVSKQQQMFEMTFEEVECERPRRQELEVQVQNQEQKNEVDRSGRGVQTVADCMGRKLFSYFRHWLNSTVYYRYTLHKKIKMRILNLYLDKLRKGFNHWKHNKANKNQVQVQMQMEELEHEGNQLQNDIIQMEKEVKQKKADRDENRQSQLDRVTRHTLQRFVKNRFLHWRDQCQKQQTMEGGASKIINRLRKRFLRKAFDRYRDQLREEDQFEYANKRTEYFKTVLKDRLMKRCYEAWAQYRHDFEVAKNAAKRMANRINNNQAREAVKKWKEFCNILEEEKKTSVKKHLGSQVAEQNAEIGELSNQVESQGEAEQKVISKLTRQSQQIIANKFARFFHIHQSEAFYIWKNFNSHTHHAEQLLKNILAKYRKSQLMRLKQAWQKFQQDQIIQEHREILHRKEQENHDLEFQKEKASNDNNQEEEDLKDFIENTQEQTVFYQKRASKAMMLLQARVDGNHYMSKKRYILLTWLDYAKSRKKACNTFNKAISHFLWNCGLQALKDQSKDELKDQKKAHHMTRFFLKAENRCLSSSFNKWKSGCYQTVVMQMEETEMHEAGTQQDFQTQVSKIRNFNCDRAEKMVENHRTKKLFRMWWTIAHGLGNLNRRNITAKENFDLQQAKFAIMKWNERAKRTKEVRNRIQRLKSKAGTNNTKDVFEAWRQLSKSNVALCNRLGMLATQQNQGGLMEAFMCIKNFSNSKHAAQSTNKQNSMGSISTIFESLIRKRLKDTMDELKNRGQNWHYQDTAKRRALLACMNQNLKSYFTRWKNQMDKEQEAEEIYDEGPARMREREQTQNVRILKDLMKKEGFTDEQIAKALDDGDAANKEKINRVICRMNHYNDELYCKPKFWDKWVMWVKMRKLWKYWLQRMNNITEPPKSDMASAFYRWFYQKKKREDSLNEMSREDLEKLLIGNQKSLNDLEEEAFDNEVAIEQLENQRDILVGNLFSSQRLALGYINSQNKLAKLKGILRWQKASLNNDNTECEENLKENMRNIVEMRSAINNLRNENEEMEEENEEMRQAAMEGIEMAKTVGELNKERENLSVDLADKAAMIKKLLDDNSNLNNRLKSAQEEAQTLLRMSNNNPVTLQ